MAGKIEVLVCAAQEQALQENSIKHHIDGQDVSPMCRLCDKSSETVMHLSSGCLLLAKSKYRIRHDIVGKHIHCLLLKEYGIATGNKPYKPIKTDRHETYNRPDLAVIDREENTWYIIDFAIPMDHHVMRKKRS